MHVMQPATQFSTAAADHKWGPQVSSSGEEFRAELLRVTPQPELEGVAGKGGADGTEQEQGRRVGDAVQMRNGLRICPLSSLHQLLCVARLQPASQLQQGDPPCERGQTGPRVGSSAVGGRIRLLAGAVTEAVGAASCSYINALQAPGHPKKSVQISADG